MDHRSFQTIGKYPHFALHPSSQELKTESLTLCHIQPVVKVSAVESPEIQQSHGLQRTQYNFQATTDPPKILLNLKKTKTKEVTNGLTLMCTSNNLY